MRNWAHGSNRLKALGWAEMWSSKRGSSAPTTPCNHGFVGVLSLGHGCDSLEAGFSWILFVDSLWSFSGLFWTFGAHFGDPWWSFSKPLLTLGGFFVDLTFGGF
jgi:hypothetical protein